VVLRSGMLQPYLATLD
jgi:hypothetical protein